MNLTKKKVLMICGSTKAASTNSALIDHIVEKNAESFQFIKSIEIDKLPHFNPDLENENLPDLIREFRAQIFWADGVIFCTPEYVFGLPGSFKNAIDWLVSTSLLSNKPVLLIIAASSGEAALAQLTKIMETLETKISGTLLIKGAKSKFNSQQKLIDEKLIQNLTEMTAKFGLTIG